jgi:hypothetical protein
MTVWVFAKMGTTLSVWMMEKLERWTEVISGDFNSQELVNTLWAFAKMGTRPVERMMGQLE